MKQGDRQEILLIADQDPDIHRSISTFLAGTGLAIKAVSPTGLIEPAWDGIDVCAILLGWDPGEAQGPKSTHSLIRILRQRRPGTPVLCMAGGDALLEAKWQEGGSLANEWLQKPLEAHSFRKALSKLLSRDLATPLPFDVASEDEIIPLAEMKQRYVRKAFEVSGYDIGRTAKKLGVHRHTVIAILGDDYGKPRNSKLSHEAHSKPKRNSLVEGRT